MQKRTNSRNEAKLRIQKRQEKRNKISTQAREFILAFGTYVRQLRVHTTANRSAQNAQKALIKVIRELQNNGENALTIVFAEGHSFVNGVWVRTTHSVWDMSLFLTETLLRMRARGISLAAKVSAPAIADMASIMKEYLSDGAPIPEDVTKFGMPGVTFYKIPDKKEEETRKAGREAAISALREGLLVAGDGSNVTELDLFMRRRQKALVQRLVQLAENHPENLLALTTVRDAAVDPGTHAFMVTVLSVALGRSIGLQRDELLRLGVTVLNHNIGSALLPESVFLTPRKLTEIERSTIEQHSLSGTLFLLENYGFSPPIIDRAIVCAEHHIHANGQNGYPFALGYPPHLFARIIAVCDAYHALTSARPHRSAFPPDQAIKLLRRLSVPHVDPLLVKAFIRLIGRYPPGSLVELDTGEFAIIIGLGTGAKPLQRPKILLISDPEGNPMQQFLEADLNQRHQRRRAWIRTIMRTHDPKRLPDPISAYLFADRIVLPTMAP